MYVSPLIGVPALLVAAVIATSWFAEPPAAVAPHVSVSLSATAYDLLALQATRRAGADGRPLTVEQFIETLARDP